MNSESASGPEKDFREEEIRELRNRIARLENALVRQRILDAEWVAAGQTVAPVASPLAQNTVEPQIAEPAPIPEATAAPMPTVSASAATTPEAAPLFASMASATSASSTSAVASGSLETRIASQWFNRIGILAVLIGAAWFLKFAFDNHWIGPLGRVLIGLVAGAGLIVWSERFRAKGYAAFSYSLKATGSGILYLSLWAAFSMYHLMPGAVVFAAMIAVTAFNGYLAWVQESELLALYAIVGALCTPALISTGENHEITLFSYMLLLDLAVLVLVALRPWSRLLFCAFVGTVVYVLGWSAEYYSREQAARTAVFFAAFFLVFALAPRLVLLHAESDAEGIELSGSSAWDALVGVAMPVFVAGLGFLAFYLLVDSVRAHWAEPWLAVLFAGFYLLLMRLPAQGRWRAGSALLSHLHLSTAVVFLTIAIPLKASGRWITIGWLVEGAALLWVASRLHSRLLRALAELCLLLAFVALLTIHPPAALTPVLNQRFATYLAAIAVFAFVAWLAAHAEPDARHDQILPWPSIAAIAGLLVNILILLAVSLEIDSYWWSLHWHGQAEMLEQYRIYAQFTYSAFFMIFGAVLLALGFWRHSAFLRWQALILLAVTIAKVFLVDVSELSQGYRIVSFLGLGALLLAVSFVYQRDLFNLRQRGGESA